MADIAASLNQFPFVTFAEQGSGPATPASGLCLLYRKDDGKWYGKDDAGVETEIGSGGGGGGGSGWTSVPASMTAAGTAGQYASDGVFLYICHATNSWTRRKLEPFGTGTFNCCFPGDANGVIYDIATASRTAAWTNPHTAGYVTVVPSTVGSGNAAMLVDRAASAFFTTDTANSYVGIDLGSGRALKVTEYTIRARSSGGHYLRHWKLQGTNSVSANTAAGFTAATWTDIDTHVHDASIDDISKWALFPVNTLPAAYRYLRILQTGLTESAGNFLSMGEFEFYGKL